MIKYDLISIDVANQQLGVETWGLCQHIQKSTGFLSNVLFGPNHEYFVRVQVIFTLCPQSEL
jgi:hypothetical protein